MIQVLVCFEVQCHPIVASSSGLTVVQSWIHVNDGFWQVWKVSGCLSCQLVVDFHVQLSLESGFWLVALQVESVDWALTFVVEVLFFINKVVLNVLTDWLDGLNGLLVRFFDFIVWLTVESTGSKHFGPFICMKVWHVFNICCGD